MNMDDADLIHNPIEVEDKPAPAKAKKKAAPLAKIQSRQDAARARALEKLRAAGR